VKVTSNGQAVAQLDTLRFHGFFVAHAGATKKKVLGKSGG